MTQEMVDRDARRVACDRVVLFTWDPAHPGFWLVDEYFPEIFEIDRPLFPSLHEIEQVLGATEVHHVPIPADCCDGFLGAYWRRPATYLDARARQAISTFSKLADVESGLERLRADLADGTWESRHEALLGLSELDIGYRLIVAQRALTTACSLRPTTSADNGVFHPRSGGVQDYEEERQHDDRVREGRPGPSAPGT